MEGVGPCACGESLRFGLQNAMTGRSEVIIADCISEEPGKLGSWIQDGHWRDRCPLRVIAEGGNIMRVGT